MFMPCGQDKKHNGDSEPKPGVWVIHLPLPRMQSIDQVDHDYGWQAMSVSEAGHSGGRSPPGTEKTRVNQIEASAGGEPTLWKCLLL